MSQYVSGKHRCSPVQDLDQNFGSYSRSRTRAVSKDAFIANMNTMGRESYFHRVAFDDMEISNPFRQLDGYATKSGALG